MLKNSKTRMRSLPSIRLLQRAGCRYEGRIRKSFFRDGNWFEELEFALSDEDFKQNNDVA